MSVHWHVTVENDAKVADTVDWCDWDGADCQLVGWKLVSPSSHLNSAMQRRAVSVDRIFWLRVLLRGREDNIDLCLECNKLCGLLWGRHNMPPPPASGDLYSHLELSAWMTYYTNHPLDVNVPVKHTSCAVPAPASVWPFDLQMGSWVTRVMGFIPANFQLPAPFRSRLGQARDRQTDRQTYKQRPSTLNALIL